MKIYDCFLFFNEIELLDIRFKILNDFVDKFVIVESTKTFSGKKKELFFEKNINKFQNYTDKIIHVVIEDTPEDFFNLTYSKESSEINDKILNYVDNSTGWSRHEKQWGRETFQRECILRGLKNCENDDIILISDLDEIPNPKIIENFKTDSKKEVYDLKQNFYLYYINLLKETEWSGTKMIRWESLENISVNLVRQNKYTTKTISNGGWHFSFMGGIERIRLKLESYSHQEYNTPFIHSHIEDNIKNEKDLFFRGKLTKVGIDSTYPDYVLNNLDEFKKMIKY